VDGSPVGTRFYDGTILAHQKPLAGAIHRITAIKA
jgi:hypothetical protein